ncbi:hypothetical protein Mgra_00008849 [Meloidogyne graminicola]|uniref:SPRY domain-containing protein n=1 Tax=Meloidogyne graminicola TaxID=189291 RepID=A0A8S9ZEP7_9BILA|nr:hypothetical protein Mgra_00008849 [Meloidogyne graminicola]
MSESSSNSNLDGKAEEDSVAINPENKELKEEKSLCFVKVSNKWNVLIDSTFCGNECLGYNSNVVCMNGIGFIQTLNETNIRYFNRKDKHGITKRAEIIAENCFNKPNEYSEISQLNYYEIKLQTEGNTWIEIGFKKANDFYVNFKLMGCSISYNYNFKYFKPPSICLKNGDVIGCGLVYPSGNINNKFPYVFFTHNGEQKVFFQYSEDFNLIDGIKIKKLLRSMEVTDTYC